MELTETQFSEIIGVRADQPIYAAGEEKRAHDRVSFGSRARIFPLIDGAGGNGCPVLMRDISRIGVGFMFTEELAVGDEFILQLPRHDGSVVIIQCMVNRCEPGGTGLVHFIIGATFELVLDTQQWLATRPEVPANAPGTMHFAPPPETDDSVAEFRNADRFLPEPSFWKNLAAAVKWDRSSSKIRNRLKPSEAAQVEEAVAEEKPSKTEIAKEMKAAAKTAANEIRPANAIASGHPAAGQNASAARGTPNNAATATTTSAAPDASTTATIAAAAGAAVESSIANSSTPRSSLFLAPGAQPVEIEMPKLALAAVEQSEPRVRPMNKPLPPLEPIASAAEAQVAAAPIVALPPLQAAAIAPQTAVSTVLPVEEKIANVEQIAPMSAMAAKFESPAVQAPLPPLQPIAPQEAPAKPAVVVSPAELSGVSTMWVSMSAAEISLGFPPSITSIQPSLSLPPIAPIGFAKSPRNPQALRLSRGRSRRW